jgi:hypothetical protein
MLGAFLVLVAVVGLLVFVAMDGIARNDPDRVEFHRADSDDEKAAAAAALAYLRALQQGQAEVACRYAAAGIAKQLRCTGRPRIPRALRIDPGGRLDPFHVRTRGPRISVWVSGADPGPVQDLDLRRVGRTWRVNEHSRFGFA